MTAHARQGVALLCDAGSIVRRVIRDELGLPGLFAEGLSLAAAIAPTAADAFEAFHRAVIDRGAAFDRELPLRVADGELTLCFSGVADGELFYVVAKRSTADQARSHNELLLSNNEQTNALRAAWKELGQRRQREASLDSRLYDDLSRLNSELATLQREMAKKNSELEQLSALRNELLGMAAHDLRSPLGVIQNYSDFLEVDAGPLLNDEQRAFISTITRTSRVMLGMVDDLLDVTSIEAGRLTLDRQPSDLCRLLADNVNVNRTLAARKDIAVEFAPVGPLPLVALDADRIQQVLNNLIGNAIKFSTPGNRVSVTAAVSGDAVIISIADQGLGLSASDLTNLFKPFARATVRGTAGEKSTGLGLAIARSIVEAHGGRIWAESELGKGATFFVSLPVTAP